LRALKPVTDLFRGRFFAFLTEKVGGFNVSEEKKNLKGKDEQLLYFRYVDTGKKEPVERIRRGKREIVLNKVLEKVYLTEEQVRDFSLEEYGQQLPRVGNGHFTMMDNYFIDYWGHFLGAGAVTAFMHLLRFTYGDKDYCFPSLSMIQQKMNVSKPTLNSYLETLEHYGFLVRFWVQNPEKKNLEETAIFKIRKIMPMLTQELLDQLPSKLRQEHDKYIASLKKSDEIKLHDKDDYSEVLDSLIKQGERKQRKTKKKLTEREKNELVKQALLNRISEEDKQLWKSVLDILETKVSKPTYDTWFAHTIALREGSMITIHANEFVIEHLSERYESMILEVLRDFGIETITYTAVPI
jgi:hypothetical protein